jgi:hypothetical protein
MALALYRPQQQSSTVPVSSCELVHLHSFVEKPNKEILGCRPHAATETAKIAVKAITVHVFHPQNLLLRRHCSSNSQAPSPTPLHIQHSALIFGS